MASANNHFEVLKALLEYGATELEKTVFINFLNDTNNDKNTALHWAAMNGALESCKVCY